MPTQHIILPKWGVGAEVIIASYKDLRDLWALHWEVTISQTVSLTLGCRSLCSNYIRLTGTFLRHCHVVPIVWPLLISQWLVLNFTTFLSLSMFLILKNKSFSTLQLSWWVTRLSFLFFFLNFNLFYFALVGVVVARAEGGYKWMGNEWNWNALCERCKD